VRSPALSMRQARPGGKLSYRSLSLSFHYGTAGRDGPGTQ
jgi:hypothetical protein